MAHNRLILKIIGVDHPLPQPQFALLIAILVGALQIPASFIMIHFNLGIGVMINEVAVILSIPLFLSYALRFDTRILFPFVLPRAVKWVAGAIATLGVAIIIDYLTAASDAIWPPSAEYNQVMDYIMAVLSRGEYAYKLFLLCIVPAFCEEIFFRGFCQNIFAHFKGNVFAILATGVLFALLHGNPWHMHLYFLLGCFLSWIYVVTRTLWLPILCHFLNNAWTFTHHAAGTTLPWKNISLITQLGIVLCGIFLAIAGGTLIMKSKNRISGDPSPAKNRGGLRPVLSEVEGMSTR